MPLEKHCVSRGCRAIPMFGFGGFGSALTGAMRWACARHKALLGCYDEVPKGPPRQEEERAGLPAARSSSTNSQAQKSLF